MTQLPPREGPYPFEFAPYHPTFAKQMARPTVIRWTTTRLEEHTFESSEDLEIQIKLVELWLRWKAGQVKRIIVEH
jgi:hypothetical protein